MAEIATETNSTPPGIPPASPSRPLAGLLHVSGLTIVSRVLGLVRDAAMAASFGNGPVLDAFTVAFRLPNITRRLFGEAAFSTAFLPIFVREQQAGTDAGWKLATAILVVTAAAVSTVTIVAEIVLVASWLLVAPGETRLLLGLTAALFPYQVFVCVAAQAAAVLHAHGRFSLPALLPIVANVVWLVALAIALAAFESDVLRIYALACGIVVSGMVQGALTVPALKRLGFRFRWDWNATKPRVKEVALAVLPVLAGLAVTELNGLIDGLFAWLLTAPADAVSPDPLRYPLEPGSAAALFLGQRLYQFPLGVFGVALGTVLFPQLARHAAAGRRDELRSVLTLGLKLSIAIGLPASVGLALTARPLADALFRYGAFDAQDAAQTSTAIAAYGVGVWAFIALLIANRGFYAVGDRTTPLTTGIAATLLNVALSVTLVWPFGGPGLAIATSIAASFQVALSIVALRRRDLSPALPAIAVTGFKAIVATAMMGVACYLLRERIMWGAEPLQRVLALAVPVAGGLAVYLAAAKLVGLREVWLLVPRKR
ncbi:MAG: murein biosynthesis integral membrane protein MurJ [Planctomycetaceae bacterium]